MININYILWRKCDGGGGGEEDFCCSCRRVNSYRVFIYVRCCVKFGKY